MKIIYFEETDSATLHFERQETTGTLSGYDYNEKTVLHLDEAGKLHSAEILSGASKALNLERLDELGLLECDKTTGGMGVEEFRQWREKLIEGKRKSTKAG